MTDPLTSRTSQTSIDRPDYHYSGPTAATNGDTRAGASAPGGVAGAVGAGTMIGGRYQLRVAVGHGGMGTVWRATDTQLGRSVAVKEVVTPPGIAPEDRDAMYERMLREARAAAVLSHPGVVQVYDVVTDSGRPWIVMELLDARSLSDMVLEDGPLAPRAVAKIGVTLLGALEVAHAAGVLHRDVKPANVLVCTDGRCVLTDFGVARMPTDQQLTTPGMVLGSPHFISPERALGASFGPPSDLFSLGVTLFCAVEGRPPFDKGEPIATMHSVVEDEPLPPQRAGALTEVLYGLLEKDPDRRWDAPTAREVLRELLAGPLASRTPQFPTDPYSLVPSQRLPWQPAVPAGSQAASQSGSQAASQSVSQSGSPPGSHPGHQVGGRALLAPGEVPTDRAGPRHADPGGGYGYGSGPGDPYRAMPDRYGEVPDPYQHDPSSTAGIDLGQPGAPPARMPAGAAVRRAEDTARRIAGQLVAAVRRAPRKVVVGAAVGLSVVVLVTAVWSLTGGRDDPDGPAVANQPGDPVAEVPADEPLIAVQEFADRGVVVNLPEAWNEAERTDIRVDFVDPDDPIARIRLLVEQSGTSAQQFVEDIAEPTISQNCPEPYQRLDLTEIEVAGQPATLLEYTCGSGEEAQRTRWVTTVHDGTAYTFFLRLPADQFEQRLIVFDELIRSFQLTG